MSKRNDLRQRRYEPPPQAVSGARLLLGDQRANRADTCDRQGQEGRRAARVRHRDGRRRCAEGLSDGEEAHREGSQNDVTSFVHFIGCVMAVPVSGCLASATSSRLEARRSPTSSVAPCTCSALTEVDLDFRRVESPKGQPIKTPCNHPLFCADPRTALDMPRKRCRDLYMCKYLYERFLCG
jgi:hypothetical protein